MCVHIISSRSRSCVRPWSEGHYAKFSAELITGGNPMAEQKKKLDRPLDVVVGRSSHSSTSQLNLSQF